MSENVERSTLNARYERHRLRDDAGEARLPASVAERGIEKPPKGVDTSATRFLLGGFKCRRCARKLGLDTVPYVSLAEKEASGIIALTAGLLSNLDTFKERMKAFHDRSGHM